VKRKSNIKFKKLFTTADYKAWFTRTRGELHANTNTIYTVKPNRDKRHLQTTFVT